MMMKYRVYEVAKDLGVPSKDVLDFLTTHFTEAHKPQTALTEEELNLIFEHYTKKSEVQSFDGYFDMKPPAKPAAEQPAAEQPAAKQPEAAQAAQPAAQNSPAQTRPVQAQHAGQNRPAQQRPAANGQNRPGHGAQNRPANGQSAPARGAQQRPAHAGQPGGATAAQRANAADRTVRHVDTRGAQVELDKYNPHYEEIAPDRGAAKKDNGQRKQKLHQRSANRRPKFAKHETEAEKLKRLAFEKSKKVQLKVSIPDEINVGELAARLKVTAADLIKKLVKLGTMAAISDTIDYDTAALAAMEFNAKVEHEVEVTIEDQLIDDSEDKEEDLQPRDPVVCVMGHVDHGKTSLLDAIRHSNVATGEAGGITQHIGAYRVRLGERSLTFLDTPGHAAFTAMRARGAQATDIAILVVAADDGIMPQTIEAINHAKAAKINIIVAINKIDKPGADPQRVMQGLTEHGLVPEEWGGETICVPVSAKQNQNIDKLLEMVLLVADMQNLRANPNRAGRGVVIEARLDKGRGPVATLLVQNGTLRTGDVLIAGTAVGHVRAMTDENGNTIETAGPAVPVEITGLAEVPAAGDIFHCVKDERMARELVEQRRTQEKEQEFGKRQKVTLDNLFSQMQEGEIKEFNVIVKADVQGSAEAIKQSLEKLSNDEVRLNVIHSGVGAINESDVQLADAFGALVIGFNVRPEPAARDNAAMQGVELRMYRVIYDCINEVESAMKGMLDPKVREVQLGRVEVRQVYKISNVGTIAGCYVLEGKITRAAQIRVVRDGIVITEDQISSLKRFKDDAKEVQQGFECGVGLEKFNDIKEGDIFEPFVMEEYRD